MSRKKRLLCILLALAVVIGGVCCWQRNNLRALGMAMKLSQDELSGKMNQQQERTEEASRQAGVTVRALTDEEKAELHGSEVSREELIDRITDGAQPAADEPAADKPAAPASEPQEPEDGEAALRGQLARQIAEIYVMEAEYTDWLAQANQAAIDEFTALPESEQTTANKYSIGMKYLSAALEKEKECDARMKAAEDSIRSLLTQLGEDTSLADEIHAAYLEEKAAKKAYYLSLH